MTTSTKNTPLATAPHDADAASDSPMSPAVARQPSVSSVLDQRMREMEDALRERDSVVQMLTQRLEQAADQLDRVQRTGSDRRGAGTSGAAPELIEGQQTLLEQMARLLGEWDEIQAGSMLQRIESQIGELKELVSSGATIGSPRASTGISHAPRSPNIPVSPPPSRPEPNARQNSSWELIKARMMEDETLNSPASSATASTAKPASNVAEATPALVSTTPAGPSDAPAKLPDPPPFVDVDQAAMGELQDAVQARDEYISMLIRRIVAHDQSTRLPDWETLNQAPHELRCELDNLRQQLQQKLRIAEVDLSLQRARLAREDAKLQVKAEQVVRQMRQMGIPTDETAATASPAPGRSNEGQQGRRWLQFLQRPSLPNNSEGS